MVAGQNTETQNTQAQNTQAQNTRAQNTQTPNTQTQSTRNQNTQGQNTQAWNTQNSKVPKIEITILIILIQQVVERLVCIGFSPIFPTHFAYLYIHVKAAFNSVLLFFAQISMFKISHISKFECTVGVMITGDDPELRSIKYGIEFHLGNK